jgi:hypothetical protein
MQLKHRVALNGAQLDELDERVLVLGVTEGAARLNITTANRFGGGQRVSSEQREPLDVNVTFGIRLRSSADELVQRREIFEKVTAWAMGGGWLTTNIRPGRRIYVRCAQLPAAGDLAEWASEYTTTFRAYGVPFWQGTNPSSFVAPTTKGNSKALEIAGTAPSVLEFSLQNTSTAELSEFTLTAGAHSMAFEALGLMPGETLELDHDAEGLLRIRIQSAEGAWRSAMAARKAESDDELKVSPGSVTVGWTSRRAGLLTVRCYGRYV